MWVAHGLPDPTEDYTSEFVVPPQKFFVQALDKLRCDLGMGTDGLPSTFVKQVPKTASAILRGYMETAARLGVLAPDLLQARLVLILKPGKDRNPSEVLDHRGLSCSSVLGKPVLHALLHRLQEVSYTQHHFQFAGGKGVSSSLLAACLYALLSIRTSLGLPTFPRGPSASSLRRRCGYATVRQG